MDFWQVKIVLDTVDGADYIGDQSDVEIYATQRRTSSSVTITLKKTPSNTALPANFVTWTGGTPTSDQLQRLFDPGSLQVSGVELRANAGTPVVFNSKVYVFQEKPTDEQVEMDLKRHRDNNIVPGGDFGRANMLDQTTTDYIVYYENTTWKYVFERVEYDNPWGIQSQQRYDVPSDYTWDYFPLGYQMNSSYTYIKRRYIAKADLCPNYANPYNRPTRDYYWASHISIQHENFHLNDWYTPCSIRSSQTTLLMNIYGSNESNDKLV